MDPSKFLVKMAFWSYWFWVTNMAFIIEWLVGCGVTANSLLVGPVRANQMSLQMRNLTEVWRQAREGFPVATPMKAHSLVDNSSLVEGKVIKQNHELSLVEGQVTKQAHAPGFVNKKVSKLVHEPSLVNRKVTRIPVHDQLFIRSSITIPIHGHSFVQDNATLPTVDKKVLPVRKGIIGKGEIVKRGGGIPEKVLDKQVDMVEGVPPIQLLEDNVAENHTSLTNQVYESFNKLKNNDQHKSSEKGPKVLLEDANQSVDNTKGDNSNVSVSQSVSKVSMELGSNRTIIPRHFKRKFPRVESWSGEQVTSAESNGGMQQISQGIYTRLNTSNQVRLKEVEPHIDTDNKSGSDLNTDIVINKRKFKNVDIDKIVNEKEVIDDEYLKKMGTEYDTNKIYGDELNENPSKENVSEKLNETLEDIFSLNPIEMQPTEPSIGEEMIKFIRIFRNQKKDPIDINNVGLQIITKEFDNQEGDSLKSIQEERKIYSANKTKNYNKSKETLNNNTKLDGVQANAPEVENILIDDNSTLDKQLSDQDLATLKSLTHENSERKLETSVEDTNLNSSRAGKAIIRRPLLTQVKPDDISIIFSTTKLEERRSPHQTKDLKYQKVSSGELNKVKEHMIAMIASIEEKHPQKGTLVTDNQQNKSLANHIPEKKNAPLENSENDLENMLNLHLHSENLGEKINHFKTVIDNNESSALNASSLNEAHGIILKDLQVDYFIRTTILPYLLKTRTTYPPLLTSLTRWEKESANSQANVKRQTQDKNTYHQKNELLSENPAEHQGANNVDIHTKEDRDLSDDLIANDSIIDFVSQFDNQSMEGPHIGIEVEGRAVSAKFMDITNAVAVALGSLVFIIIVIVISAAVLYRRRFLMKPHSLGNCYTNSESGSSCWPEKDIFQTVSYQDCQGIDLPRDNSEEMINLDDDSFLKSLEAMTIPEYSNDSIRHTKQ